MIHVYAKQIKEFKHLRFERKKSLYMPKWLEHGGNIDIIMVTLAQVLLLKNV